MPWEEVAPRWDRPVGAGPAPQLRDVSVLDLLAEPVDAGYRELHPLYL